MHDTRQKFCYTPYFAVFVTILTTFGPNLVNAQTNPSDDDAPRVTAVQRLKIGKLNRELHARINPVAQRDPRYAKYLKAVAKLRRVKDPKELERSFKEFTKNYAGFRDDVLRKARVDVKQYNLRLQKILPRIEITDDGLIKNVESVSLVSPMPSAYQDDSTKWMQNASYLPNPDTTTEFTSFPNKTSYNTCVNQGSTEFNGSGDASAYGETDVNVDDCDKVRASRGVIVNIPSDVNRVRVEIEINQYSLRTWAACWGVVAYADAYASVGIRFHRRASSLSFYKRHAHSESEWSVLGDQSTNKSATNVVLSGTFYPYGAGEYDIQGFARISVDTDGFAASHSFSSIDGMTKMKVTFIR
ncbi:MAG: hypothetical protein ABIP78_05330 [Pyrinomonadaceae bacterium]